MAGELGALILVDSVGDVSIRTRYVDLAAASDAALGGMATCSL